MDGWRSRLQALSLHWTSRSLSEWLFLKGTIQGQSMWTFSSALRWSTPFSSALDHSFYGCLTMATVYFLCHNTELYTFRDIGTDLNLIQSPNWSLSSLWFVSQGLKTAPPLNNHWASTWFRYLDSPTHTQPFEWHRALPLAFQDCAYPYIQFNTCITVV